MTRKAYTDFTRAYEQPPNSNVNKKSDFMQQLGLRLEIN